MGDKGMKKIIITLKQGYDDLKFEFNNFALANVFINDAMEHTVDIVGEKGKIKLQAIIETEETEESEEN